MVGRLTKQQRLQVAELSGAAVRLGRGRDIPEPVAVAELHEISTDPVLLGIAAASALVELERFRNPARRPRARAAPEGLRDQRRLVRAGVDDQFGLARATTVEVS